jgi:hypothetical protein
MGRAQLQLDFTAAPPKGFLSLLLIGLMTVTGCGEITSRKANDQGDSATSQARSFAETASATLIVNGPSGAPIAGAKVMVGTRANVPFPGNVLTTDRNGQVRVPNGWNSPQPVTVEAAGFVRATYFGRSPQDGTLRLSKSVSDQNHELKGVVSGYGNLPNDGWMDVGFVIPAIHRSQLNFFQAAALVSSEVDSFKVFGQTVEIPSNLTIPRQRETYIIPLTFEKPTYRTYLTETGTIPVAATHVKFPFREVADALRGGTPLIQLINKFQFLQTSIRNVAIGTGSTSQDLVVNEIKFDGQATVKAPGYAPELTMISISLAETGNHYYITDTKKIDPGKQINLAIPRSAAGRGVVVSVLGKFEERTLTNTNGDSTDNFSAVTTLWGQSESFDFLAIPKAPEVRNSGLRLHPPRSVAGVAPALTYAVLSKVEVVDKGTFKLEKKFPQWELYASDWASSLDLPDFPNSNVPQGKHRWEVSFGGQSAGSGRTLPGPDALEKASHVTRSVVDL